MRHLLAITGLCLLCVAPALASMQILVHQPTYRLAAATEISPARIDWVRQAVIVSTQAEAPLGAMGPRARTGARALALAGAQRQIAEYLNVLPATGYATLGDLVIAGTLPDTTLTELSHAAKPAIECWDTDRHMITLTCALPLSGPTSLNDAAARILKIEQQVNAKAPRIHATDTIKLFPVKPVTQLSDGPYTGIIFDCTGMNYHPALLPKLINKDGAELWGTDGLNPLAVMETGVCGYAASIEKAKDDGRVGASPLILRPAGLAGVLQSDLVISADDAVVLADQKVGASLLSALAVVILVD